MKLYSPSTKVFDANFKRTFTPAGVIALSARQRDDTPTPFARKWIADN
jgi:hypothetical protein